MAHFISASSSLSHFFNTASRSLGALVEARYRLRTAQSDGDVRLAQSLRFSVFNLELGEGLARSFETCLDSDPFDAVCEHLLVEDIATGNIVGTYRMQLGRTAQTYYCEREFDFSPYEAVRHDMLELGRACIHAEHRSFAVLSLLWKGIMAYARTHGARYLVGCSSLTSQDMALGLAAYAHLQRHQVAPAFRTQPHADFVCHASKEQIQLAMEQVKIPKLLSAYLALGAGVCGLPAMDREFKTIDFLTWLDLDSPDMAQRRRRFGF